MMNKLIKWAHEILTPENVKYEDASVDWLPESCFMANAKEDKFVYTHFMYNKNRDSWGN